MTFILCLLIFLPKILSGFAIAHLLWQDFDIPAIILKLSVGVPLGFAISASAFFIALLLGIRPETYSWMEFWGVLVLDIFFLIRSPVLRSENIPLSKISWQGFISIGIVLVGAGLFISAFLIYSRMHPYGFEDAWSMWNLTPRFIFRENSPAILLNNRFYNRFHPDYPVELSLNVAWGWFILKNETPRIPTAVAFLSTITLGTTFWATLAKWKSLGAATVGTLIIFIVPDLPAVIGQYADPLFTLHLLAATGLFYGYLKTRKLGLLIMSSLLTGFSAWVKNEGILFIGVMTVICFVAAIRGFIKWNELKFFAVGLVGPLLTVLTYKRMVAWQSDLFSGTPSLYLQLLDFSRWLLIGKSFITNLMNYINSPVNMVIMLLIYMVFMGFDRSETHYNTLLFLILGGQFAGYFFIYLITPHNLQLHIDTSIDRLISHLLPLAILWMFVSLRSPNLASEN